jgi:L-threonylcarbamoyladenylate synthase
MAVTDSEYAHYTGNLHLKNTNTSESLISKKIFLKNNRMFFDDDINAAVKCLRSNGVILYPTDTIWGLGCDATNNEAVEKIFRIKSRDMNKSLLILVSNEQMLERYVYDIPEIAFELISVSDGPMTIIYPKGKNLADGVCSADGSVGIRICKDEFCEQLIQRFRKPIISTSANCSGHPSPRFYQEIEKDIINSADYVVNYLQDDTIIRVASPVIKLNSDGSFKIIRK